MFADTFRQQGGYVVGDAELHEYARRGLITLDGDPSTGPFVIHSTERGRALLEAASRHGQRAIETEE